MKLNRQIIVKIFLKIISIFVAIFLILTVGLFALDIKGNESKMEYGVTFSKPFADFLGVDWKETYAAILDDLGARKIRLMSYWTETERTKGNYSFEDLDWQINEAKKRNAEIILVVGQKQPRWPECHIPDWAKDLPLKERQDVVIELDRAVINRYKDEKNIVAWQVENEPFFHFGICPEYDDNFLDREISLVHSLDPNRPVIVTDSGELSSWYKSGKRADILGTTLYRTVWNKDIGYVNYPFPASYYWLKGELIKLITGVQKVIVVELQGEAWGAKMPNDMTLEEQYQSMNPAKLKKIAEYARLTGFSESYFWGAEWWYWLKKSKGEDGMWQAAKEIFSQAR